VKTEVVVNALGQRTITLSQKAFKRIPEVVGQARRQSTTTSETRKGSIKAKISYYVRTASKCIQKESLAFDVFFLSLIFSQA